MTTTGVKIVTTMALESIFLLEPFRTHHMLTTGFSRPLSMRVCAATACYGGRQSIARNEASIGAGVVPPRTLESRPSGPRRVRGE